MIYPGKKKPDMIQVAGNGGEVQSLMEGKERIYSRSDTKRIIDLARAAKSNQDLVALGKFVFSATKKQDSRPPEFVEK
jgi:replication-associated recombination protein RarA